MMSVCYKLKDESQTLSLGAYLAPKMTPGLVIGLQGDIGMGKTCLVRAILRSLGVQSAIKSPTFNLVETYFSMDGLYHHFDLYRLASPYELEELGFRDYLNADSICFIEWPEKAPFITPFMDFMIEFSLQLPGRKICMHAISVKGQEIIEQCKRETWQGGKSSFF